MNSGQVALGTVQTSQLVAEPGAPPAAEHLAVLVLELVPEPGAEPEAELGLVQEAAAEVDAKLVAELVDDMVVALVFGVALGVAAVARTGSGGVTGNGLRSDPFPGSMAQRSALVDLSVQHALEVIETAGIERGLRGLRGPSAPHRRTRDAGSGDGTGQGHHCFDSLEAGPPLSSQGRRSAASHNRSLHGTYQNCAVSLKDHRW